jgi:hypothetical protein
MANVDAGVIVIESDRERVELTPSADGTYGELGSSSWAPGTSLSVIARGAEIDSFRMLTAFPSVYESRRVNVGGPIRREDGYTIERVTEGVPLLVAFVQDDVEVSLVFEGLVGAFPGAALLALEPGTATLVVQDVSVATVRAGEVSIDVLALPGPRGTTEVTLL